MQELASFRNFVTVRAALKESANTDRPRRADGRANELPARWEEDPTEEMTLLKKERTQAQPYAENYVKASSFTFSLATNNLQAFGDWHNSRQMSRPLIPILR